MPFIFVWLDVREGTIHTLVCFFLAKELYYDSENNLTRDKTRTTDSTEKCAFLLVSFLFFFSFFFLGVLA